ncbi:ABC transporter ATP-binding protein [Bifidobacterium psychraerophilum]|uniref:ABC transporter ATP-binding protein n=1 Tax=Bifidobacterium psychraerophilum TaxID=218140 RepID=UPI00310F521E
MSAASAQGKPSLISRYRVMISEEGQSRFTSNIALSAASGIVTGLSLLVLLPASATLSGADTSLGLGFWGWMIVLALLGAAGAVIEYLGAIASYESALDIIRNLLRRVGDKLAKLPIGWFHESSAGNLSRFASQDVMTLGQSVAHLLGKLIQNACCVGVVIIGVLVWDVRLGLILALSVPVMLLMLRLSQYCITRGKHITDPAEQEISDRIVEFGRCQGALRACGRSTSFKELDEASAASTAAQKTSLWWGTAANLLTGVIGQLIVVLMIVFAARFAMAGTLGPVSAIAFIGLSLRFMQTLEELGGKLLGVEDNRVMLDHLDDIFNAPTLSEPDAPAELSDKGAVSLRDVNFSYLPEHPVLRDVSFDVKPGQMVALVGPSGGGKSTIEKLIARFYDVTSGQIRVGGVAVQDQPVAQLMEQLSIVFQDVYLFDDTLAANIRVGRPSATDQEVQDAGALAGVSEIVDRLPDGWNSRVGEGGHALSGGERQRVSIARALLKQAPIVLLDEATSALDAENERHIMDCVERLKRTSSLLVIAHKLNTIRSADLIIVLDAKGSVVQRGTHEELIGQTGQYASFYAARHRASQWRIA